MRALPTAARRPFSPAWWPVLLCLLLPLPALALPAGSPLNLGHHLTYFRLQHLPADAAALGRAWKAPSLILDLRHPAGDAAGALPAGLPDRGRRDPLFVLVSADTPAGLVGDLRRLAPALITVGCDATRPQPDIGVNVTPQADRQAYDAFAHAGSIESLFTEKNTNERFDEATLAREHAEHPEELETPPPPEKSAEKSGDQKAPEIDEVLRRAVQIDSALRALNQLPGG